MNNITQDKIIIGLALLIAITYSLLITLIAGGISIDKLLS